MFKLHPISFHGFSILSSRKEGIYFYQLLILNSPCYFLLTMKCRRKWHCAHSGFRTQETPRDSVHFLALLLLLRETLPLCSCFPSVWVPEWEHGLDLNSAHSDEPSPICSPAWRKVIQSGLASIRTSHHQPEDRWGLLETSEVAQPMKTHVK